MLQLRGETGVKPAGSDNCLLESGCRLSRGVVSDRSTLPYYVANLWVDARNGRIGTFRELNVAIAAY